MLEIEEYLFKERFDTKYTKFDTKYLHQVSYLLDACVHHTAVYPVYHYIRVTVVNLAYCIIAVCVVVL